MKALVIKQPWATLVALGIKQIETRPGPPNGPMRPEGVRGLPGCSLQRGERIAIVAGAAVPPDAASFGDWTVWRWGAGAKMDRSGIHEVTGDEIDLPLGAVVCTVVVDDALPICGYPGPLADHLLVEQLLSDATYLRASRSMRYSDVSDQLPLGDYTEGRWGWRLTDPQQVDPIPCKGRQGVFRLPDDVAEALGGGL